MKRRTARHQSAAIGAQTDTAPAFAPLVAAPDTASGHIDTGRHLQRIGLSPLTQGLAAAHRASGLANQDGRAGVAPDCGVTSGGPSVRPRLGRTASLLPGSLRYRPARAPLTHR